LRVKPLQNDFGDLLEFGFVARLSHNRFSLSDASVENGHLWNERKNVCENEDSALCCTVFFVSESLGDFKLKDERRESVVSNNTHYTNSKNTFI
jgi:hypothetical protein